VTICGHELTEDDILLKQALVATELADHQAIDLKRGYVVLLDLSQDEQLRNAGLTREYINRVQKLRKNAGVKIEDQIFIFTRFNENAKGIESAVMASQGQVQSSVKKPMFGMSEMQSHLKVITSSSFSYEGQDFEITFTKAGVMVHQKALESLNEKEAKVLA